MPTPTNIIVPAYFPWWTDEGKQSYARLLKSAEHLAPTIGRTQLLVVINPNSGPVPVASDVYHKERLSFSMDLRMHKAVPIGYVSTKYGARSVNDIKRDMDMYVQQTLVRGFFFDEASTDPANYKQLVSMAQGVMCVLNFGVQVETVDPLPPNVFAITAETDYASFMDKPAAVNKNVLLHGVPSDVDLKALFAHGSMTGLYGSQRALEPGVNVWGALPDFWEKLVDYIKKVNSPTRVPVKITLNGVTWDGLVERQE